MRINVRLKLVLLMVGVIFFFIASFVFFLNTQKRALVSLFEEETKSLKVSFDNILKLEGKLLESYAKDYTYWDEMVEFANLPNIDWGEQNIAASLSTYNTNIASVYNKDFSLIYSVNDLDLKDEHVGELTFSRDIISSLFKQNPLGHFFVNTHKGLWEFRCASIHPTADSERKTVPQGYYFVGRAWNEDYILELSSLTGGVITFENFNEIKDYSGDSSPEKGIIKFSRILYDFDNKPLVSINLLFESVSIKDFNKKFKLFFVYFFISFGVIVFILSTFLSLWISAPLGLISKALVNKDSSFIKQQKNKNDEFGEISRLISKFFFQEQKLVKEIKQREETAEALKNKINELEVFNKLSIGRELKMVELKEEIVRLKAQIATQGDIKENENTECNTEITECNMERRRKDMKTQISVYSETQYPLSKLTEKIIGCAICVHKELGSGFIEKIYQGALAKEFTKNSVVYEKEKRIIVKYDGKAVGYQVMDFIVNDKVVVELKAVSALSNIQIGQMVSYLKAAGLTIGLVLNLQRAK